MPNELELIKSKIDKLNAFPQLEPKKSEAEQDIDVPINTPQKVISRKKALDRDEQRPIIQKAKFQEILKEIEGYSENIEKAFTRINKIPVLSIIRYESGKYSTAVRWRSPRSLGVREISFKSPKIGAISSRYGSSFTQIGRASCRERV